MWINRKKGNRRLGNGGVLEVKLRSSQVRSARIRLVVLGVGALLTVAISFLVIWRAGEWALNALVYQNKAFTVQELDVQTDGVIALDQLRRWAGVKPGENLLALDLARVKRDLEMVPFVESVSVERILPRTLRLRVTEREPIAQLNLMQPKAGGGVEMVVYHLDASGHVMPLLESRQRDNPAAAAGESYPVLSGIASGDIRAGYQLAGRSVNAALDLVAAFAHSPMSSRVEMKRVDISAPEVLIVSTGQGSEVTFSQSNIEQQLRRWQEVFDMGQRMNKVIATLDLAVPNNIPARWLEASAAPTTTPKPLRLRKKHV